MKETYLYKKLSDKKVQCQNCAHYCVIESEKRGICQIRENKNGKLYALNYGRACSVHIDPIEKSRFIIFYLEPILCPLPPLVVILPAIIVRTGKFLKQKKFQEKKSPRKKS